MTKIKLNDGTIYPAGWEVYQVVQHLYFGRNDAICEVNAQEY